MVYGIAVLTANGVFEEVEQYGKPEFTIEDSGQRREFNTGSQRDMSDDKPDYSLISHHANTRAAIHMVKGAKKYGRRNWEKGQPVSVFLASAMRHMEMYRAGDRKEDHLAAARFNIDGIIHMEEEAAKGTPGFAELLDMPFYSTPTKTVPTVLEMVTDVLMNWKQYNDNPNPTHAGLTRGQIQCGIKNKYGVSIEEVYIMDAIKTLMLMDWLVVEVSDFNQNFYSIDKKE